MIYTPRDYQIALRTFAMDGERVQWWAGTGTGKTTAGLDTFDYLWMLGEAKHLLVVTTKNIATLVWPRAIGMWENFSHLSCAVCVGTPAQRLAALRQRAHVTTVNTDVLPWLIDTLGDEWFFDVVFADESTRLKSLRISMQTSKLGKQFMRKSGGGERAMKLARVAHKRVRYWINATGTPSPNGLIDLWGQAWFVDAGERLGRSFSAFSDRWFKWEQVGNEAFQRVLVPLPHADAQIKAALRDVTMTIEAKDYMDLPPTVINKIVIPIPADAYKHYREMEKEMFTQIEEHEIEAVSAGAKMMKVRQLAAGAAYVDDDSNFTEIHSVKIDALKDIISESNGEPVIVAYYFKSDLARLRKAFPQGVMFDGKQSTLQRFIAGRIPILFIHPKSAAHGLDGMQEACRTVVFVSPLWELEEYEQLIERVGATRQVQSGQYRTVYVHQLIGENTVDEEMFERLESKASVQDALRQAMKRRG